MNTQRKYRCRKCGIDMPAGPYIAPEACSACQLAANAEIERLQKDRSRSENELDRLREWVAEVEDGYAKQAAEIKRLRGDAASLAVAREQLLVQADEIKRLLRSHYEIERLKALAIRAWHSFRSGLTATGGCLDGLTDGDILELVRLSNVEAAKKLERDVLRDCQQGNQRCHECPDTECADNMSDSTELTRLRAENADLRLQLIDSGVWEEEHPPA